MDFIRAGRALIVRDGRMGTHLWFVLTDPDSSTRHVVIVSLVTERAHTEKTVSLAVGDHPFIRHASNIDYGTATFTPAAKLNRALADSRAELTSDISETVLRSVRRGLLESSHTPNDVASYCRPLFDPPAFPGGS
ncbi:MAG: hypothetical protein ACRENI_13580 [Gemmatimonadaceae bacterium]